MRKRWAGPWAAVLSVLLAIFCAGPGAFAATAGAAASSADSEAAATEVVDWPDPWHHVDGDGEPVVRLWFGFSSTCPHCRAAAPFIQGLEQLPWLEVAWLQVDAEDSGPNVALLDDLAAETGGRLEAVPVFLFGGRLLTGWESSGTTGARLRRALESYHDRLLAAVPASSRATAERAAGGGLEDADTTVTLPVLGDVDAAGVSLPILAVVLGGLDAFNPCALAVLLFLLGILAGSRDRRRMLLIGALFVAVSGLVYLVLMAAWLNVFMVLGALRWITLVAGLAAVVAAFINLKDHVWFGRGVSLTLPQAAKPKVFGRILDVADETRLRVLVLTTVLVAAVANTYEMLCTGGFPVVFTRVLTLQDLPTATYYAYLALYCLVYVLPAVLIVLAFTLTLGSRGVSVREARDLKLLSGLLMLGFGVLLILGPDMLADLGVTVGLFAAAITAWLLILAAERLRAHHPPARQGT